jgi:hypothetical protein
VHAAHSPDSRARYLRLPTAPTRSAHHTNSRPAPTPTSVISRSVFPRRAVRTEEGSSDDGEKEAGQGWRQRAGPRSLRSDTSPPRRSQSRFSIPVTRASSPARSSAGMRLARDATMGFPARPASSNAGGERRGRLLQELRQLQRRPTTPSKHPLTREPP